MILRNENIGPLREAEVDLSKRLIVLTGPNNTGKSYFAWSTYGFHRSAPRGSLSLLREYGESLLASPLHEIDLSHLLSAHYGELLRQVAADFASNIHHCFAAERARFEGVAVALRGGEPQEAIRRLESGSRGGLSYLEQARDLAVIFAQAHGSTRLVMALSRREAADRAFGELTMNGSSGTLHDGTTTILASMLPETRLALQSTLITLLATFLQPLLFPGCVIFPAERLAVNMFARELALKRTELVDEIIDADIEGQDQVPMDVIRRRTGRYPWPIRDSLRIANDLTGLGRRKTPFADLGADIENAVLGGKVAVSDDGEMSFAPSDAPDRHLGVHLTASLVKSLSSLVFYFRHLARRGDFLIIDEPELNLHPDNQRKLARILAKAVKRGFKLMISTHSDYIVRELNHMIMLSKLPEGEARTFGYDPECALAPETVGVYLFDEHTARSLPVTETGFSVPTIDEQINSLNADAQRLHARLFAEESS